MAETDERVERESRMLERLEGEARARYFELVEARRMARSARVSHGGVVVPRVWPLPPEEHAVWSRASDEATRLLRNELEAKRGVESFERSELVRRAPSVYRVAFEVGLMEMGHELFKGGFDVQFAEQVAEIRAKHGQLGVLRWFYVNRVLGKWEPMSDRTAELVSDALEAGYSDGFNGLIEHSGSSAGRGMYERTLEKRIAFIDEYRAVCVAELKRARGFDEPFDGAFEVEGDD